jgi:hypothetical protein
MNHKAGKARLVYFIRERRLTGFAGGKPIAIFAVSGGCADKSNDRLKNWTANNPYGTRHGTAHTAGDKNPSLESHGGPIPTGQYHVLSPKVTAQNPACRHFLARTGIKRASFLVPGNGTRLFDRTGFYIHPGKHTDGCIIPVDPKQYQGLMDALDLDAGGILQVVDSIEPNAFA